MFIYKINPSSDEINDDFLFTCPKAAAMISAMKKIQSDLKPRTKSPVQRITFDVESNQFSLKKTDLN